MTVVEPDAVEDGGGVGGVLGHVLPEEGAVGGPVSVPQLHAVSPRDQLPTQVDKRTWGPSH